MMTSEINENIKQEIFRLICIPGTCIEEIAKKLNLDYDKVKEILSEEFLKHNLDHGRRLCCRF